MGNVYKVFWFPPLKMLNKCSASANSNKPGLLCDLSLHIYYIEIPQDSSRPLSRHTIISLALPLASCYGKSTERAPALSLLTVGHIDLLPHTFKNVPVCHSFCNYLKVLVLMTGHRRKSGLAQERVQSYLWGTTQQGTTFVPGRESQESRTNGVNTTIQAVDHHFSSLSVAQQGAAHNGASSDLNGVGQQFAGYYHQ